MLYYCTTAAGITGRPSYSASLGLVVNCNTGMTSLPFILIILTGTIYNLGFLKQKINLRSLTYIYIIGLAASYYISFLSACSTYGQMFGDRIYEPERSFEWLPPFMAPPSVEVAKQIISGGPMPWAELAPMMIFWWFFTTLMGIFMLSIATLFRRSWIDLEKVPFPHTLVAYDIISRIPKGGGFRSIKLTPFLIGLLLGILFHLPITLAEFFPWFPDIYGWRVSTCAHGTWYVTPDSPLAPIAGLSVANKSPLGVAIAYLAPLHILFNTWFWYVVCILIGTQIAYTMGYYTGITGLSGCGRGWCGEMLDFGPPFKWIALSTGATLGITVLLIVLNLGYLRETLLAAFGRLSPDRIREVEKNEPLSYRSIWIMLISSFILLIAVFIACGLGVASSILMAIAIPFFWIAMVRQIGLSGFYFRGTDKSVALHRLLLWPKAPEPLTREFVMSAQFCMFYMDAPENAAQTGGNLLMSFAAYKMASLTGVSSRTAFKMALLTIAILPLVTMVTYLWSLYFFGAARLPGEFSVKGCASIVSRAANPQNWNRMPGSDPWVPHFIVGFIITAVLSVLHARYVWFPFEPIGFTLATSYASLLFGVWSLALAAWILKIITLRVGGSKLYEETGIPVASGFIAGYVSMIILGGILAHIRFFMPF